MIYRDIVFFVVYLAIGSACGKALRMASEMKTENKKLNAAWALFLLVFTFGFLTAAGYGIFETVSRWVRP